MLGAGLRVDRFHQRGDVLGRCMARNAVAQIEDVPMSTTESGEHFARFALHDRR